MVTAKVDNCQLEVDFERGVLYVHSDMGVTLVRVCQIPSHVLQQLNWHTTEGARSHWEGMIDVVYDRELGKGR